MADERRRNQKGIMKIHINKMKDHIIEVSTKDKNHDQEISIKLKKSQINMIVNKNALVERVKNVETEVETITKKPIDQEQIPTFIDTRLGMRLDVRLDVRLNMKIDYIKAILSSK